MNLDDHAEHDAAEELDERGRCPECGSWEQECGNPKPVEDCRCVRCASARIESLEYQLKLVTDCNEAMREPMRLLREAAKMPAEGEGYVVQTILAELEKAKANWSAAEVDAQEWAERAQQHRDELARIQRLPELEWARVTSVIMQLLATLARQDLGDFDAQKLAKAIEAKLDAGKTYVDKVLASRDELLQGIERLDKAGEEDEFNQRWRELRTLADKLRKG